MPSILIYIGLTFAFAGSFFVIDRALGGRNKQLRRRIAREFQESAPAAAAALYGDQEGFLFHAATDDSGQGAGRDQRKTLNPFLVARRKLEMILKDAKVAIPLPTFVASASLVGFALGLAGFLLAGWHLAAPGFLLGFAAPFGHVYVKRNVLREKVLHQLPNAFDLMARTLRSGQTLAQAMHSVAEAFDDPLGSEFARCQQQQHFGLRPEAVFREMAQRMGIMELRLFVMAMVIHRQIGGNLSEILERLAAMIRTRLRLRQQIRTLTAEGRLQGWTLVVLPIVMLVAMYYLNRQYVQVLFEHKGLLVATAASMTMGILWIRKIVEFND